MKDSKRVIALDDNCNCVFCGRSYDCNDSDIKPGGYCPSSDCPSHAVHAAALCMANTLTEIRGQLLQVSGGAVRATRSFIKELTALTEKALKEAGYELSSYQSRIHASGTSYYGTLHVMELENGNLHFTLQDYDVEELQDLLNNHGDDYAIRELFEPLEANGHFSFIAPERIGALTDAPIISDVLWAPDEPILGGRFWWFKEYETVGFVNRIVNDGNVIFTKAE